MLSAAGDGPSAAAKRATEDIHVDEDGLATTTYPPGGGRRRSAVMDTVSKVLEDSERTLALEQSSKSAPSSADRDRTSQPKLRSAQKLRAISSKKIDRKSIAAFNKSMTSQDDMSKRQSVTSSTESNVSPSGSQSARSDGSSRIRRRLKSNATKSFGGHPTEPTEPGTKHIRRLSLGKQQGANIIQQYKKQIQTDPSTTHSDGSTDSDEYSPPTSPPIRRGSKAHRIDPSLVKHLQRNEASASPAETSASAAAVRTPPNLPKSVKIKPGSKSSDIPLTRGRISSTGESFEKYSSTPRKQNNIVSRNNVDAVSLPSDSTADSSTDERPESRRASARMRLTGKQSAEGLKAMIRRNQSKDEDVESSTRVEVDPELVTRVIRTTRRKSTSPRLDSSSDSVSSQQSDSPPDSPDLRTPVGDDPFAGAYAAEPHAFVTQSVMEDLVTTKERLPSRPAPKPSQTMQAKRAARQIAKEVNAQADAGDVEDEDEDLPPLPDAPVPDESDVDEYSDDDEPTDQDELSGVPRAGSTGKKLIGAPPMLAQPPPMLSKPPPMMGMLRNPVRRLTKPATLVNKAAADITPDQQESAFQSVLKSQSAMKRYGVVAAEEYIGRGPSAEVAVVPRKIVRTVRQQPDDTEFNRPDEEAMAAAAVETESPRRISAFAQQAVQARSKLQQVQRTIQQSQRKAELAAETIAAREVKPLPVPPAESTESACSEPSQNDQERKVRKLPPRPLPTPQSKEDEHPAQAGSKPLPTPPLKRKALPRPPSVEVSAADSAEAEERAKQEAALRRSEWRLQSLARRRREVRNCVIDQVDWLDDADVFLGYIQDMQDDVKRMLRKLSGRTPSRSKSESSRSRSDSARSQGSLSSRSNSSAVSSGSSSRNSGNNGSSSRSTTPSTKANHAVRRSVPGTARVIGTGTTPRKGAIKKPGKMPDLNLGDVEEHHKELVAEVDSV